MISLSRFVAWPVFLSFLVTSLGCTLVGAGIGNTIPRSGKQEMPADVRAVPRGTDVTVVYRRPDEAGGAVVSIDGVYRGSDDDRAIVEQGDKAYMIPISRIQETRARPSAGSYSLEGGLIGLGIDVAVFAFLLHQASGWNFR
jgi:hypothetical protein